MAFFRSGQGGGAVGVDIMPTQISVSSYAYRSTSCWGSGGFTLKAPCNCTVTITGRGTQSWGSPGVGITITNSTTGTAISSDGQTLSCSAGDSIAFSFTHSQNASDGGCSGYINLSWSET